MESTLIITSFTKWEEPPRLRHQIAEIMCQYFDNVLFVEMPSLLRYGFEDNISSEMRRVQKNIFACRIPSSLSLPRNAHFYLPLLSEVFQFYALAIIKKNLSKLGKRNKVLLNFCAPCYLLEDKKVFDFICFFLHDDFLCKAPNILVKKIAEFFQDKTAQKADLCLAVSTPLLGQVNRVNPNSHLFLPGHSFGEMVNKTTDLNPRQRNRKIKVAFMGYIDGRLDLEWIKHASSQKEIDFYLVGPNCIDDENTKDLQTKGVIFKQALKGKDLFEFLYSCDVLTMPYVLNKTVIACTAPNKLFQYIASGRPIVSSNMPYLLDLPNGVLQKANDKEEFVQRIKEAVAMDSEEHVKERFKIASENTWEKRGQELMNLIENGIKEKHG